MNNQLKKTERLNSKAVIEKLFAGGNGSNAVFPLRVVFMPIKNDDAPESMKDAPASILVSVPKKRFHHAVDRNRMKRLVREAYRTNKDIIWPVLEGKEYKLAIAFICITDKMPSFMQVNKSVKKALIRISEKIESAEKAAASEKTESTANSLYKEMAESAEKATPKDLA